MVPLITVRIEIYIVSREKNIDRFFVFVQAMATDSQDGQVVNTDASSAPTPAQDEVIPLQPSYKFIYNVAPKIRPYAKNGSLPRQTSHLPTLRIPLPRRHVPSQRPYSSEVRSSQTHKHDRLYCKSVEGYS